MNTTKRGKIFTWICITAILIFIALCIIASHYWPTIFPGSSKSTLKPTVAISNVCGKTRYPDICVESFVGFPGALSAMENDLVYMSMNMTLQRFEKALHHSLELANIKMDSHDKCVYKTCLELLEDSVEQLSLSLSSVRSIQDVQTWLSATLTNQDTCDEALGEVKGKVVKKHMEDKLHNLWKIASNNLAIYSVMKVEGGDVGDISTQKTPRKLMSPSSEIKVGPRHAPFPEWMGRQDRALMDLAATAINANIVVAKDGSGNYTTIAEAINAAPERSKSRTIVYVKAGRYEEDHLCVGKTKTNLMFIGDGIGKTVITGHKFAVPESVSTFCTASFAASGFGFIARDITFENYAGPSNHQAVALRMNADQAVIYRCEILGYQDTLYVHSKRQFYRESNIYGTVDFIFGNAAVVFQNCSIYARKPMDGQKNTITAQSRKDPDTNSGISIQMCNILAAPDLEESKGTHPTFLGRPWRAYSRTVYMSSYMGDHISPLGWLEWNGAFPPDTLFYGEYMNYGPGSNITGRVNWHGYRAMNSSSEAYPFTVAGLIYGSSWLPATGVPFSDGLTNSSSYIN